MVEENVSEDGAQTSTTSSLKIKVIKAVLNVLLGVLAVGILIPVVSKIGLFNLLEGIAVLMVVVTFHELGHLIAGLRAGVQIEAFSVGMGKVIAKTSQWGVEWRLSLIPSGGYVSRSQDQELTPRQALRFAWGGPFASLVVCFIAISLAALLGYNPSLAEPLKIDKVITTTARSAGLREGDVVEKIAGVDLRTNGSEHLQQVSDILATSKSAELEIIRNGQKIKITSPVKEQMVGVLWAQQPPTLSRAMQKAGIMTGICAATPIILTYMVATQPVKIAKEIGGPGQVLELAGQSGNGGLSKLLFYLGIISGAIGGFQLIPVVPLDGGHIVIAFIRVLFRQKPKEFIAKASAIYTTSSVVLFLGLISIALLNDIFRR